MSTRVCAGCGDSIPDDVPAEQVTIYRRIGRQRAYRQGHREVVCPECAARPGAVKIPGGALMWMNMGARDEAVVDCVTCGLPVILAVDKRRKVNACSDVCRARFYAKRRVSKAVTDGMPCAGCGQPTIGRADRAYCSNACRQRAYRKRLPSVG